MLVGIAGFRNSRYASAIGFREMKKIADGAIVLRRRNVC
jgi:hypothetical protein